MGEHDNTHTLDAFAQGYVEAMLEACNEDQLWPYEPLTIADLAPETVERIVADCAEMTAILPASLREAKNGRAWWQARRAGASTYPKLSLALNGSGQVVFS